MKKPELTAISRAARATLSDIYSSEMRYDLLTSMAESIKNDADSIIAANLTDLMAARDNGISEAMIDRLTLTRERIEACASAVLEVRDLPDPLTVDSVDVRQNGMKISKVRVPLGVIAMIYEARPNVTVDAAALTLKSGNAVILRGGKEAINTNLAIVKSIRRALSEFRVENAVNLIEDTSRDTVNELLTMRGEIDLVIPRGGAGLIRNVVDNARVPVIETGAGNCHVYVHKSADPRMAVNIIVNAKTSRPSVCNAAEAMLVDRDIAAEFLPMAAEALKGKGVELRVCAEAKKYLPDATLATEEDWDTEYNDYILAVKVIGDVREAAEHINAHGTRHSEAIVAEDNEAVEYFMNHIDAAALYHNASTRFTDGGVFGMGAEIGISTQKLHVRGPFAHQALTTTQYRIEGDGQVR